MIVSTANYIFGCIVGDELWTLGTLQMCLFGYSGHFHGQPVWPLSKPLSEHKLDHEAYGHRNNPFTCLATVAPALKAQAKLTLSSHLPTLLLRHSVSHSLCGEVRLRLLLRIQTFTHTSRPPC